MDENATAPLDFPTRMYLVRSDGSDLTPVSVNSMGIALVPVWTSNEGFYFSLNGDSPERDGIFYYDQENRQRTMVLAGSNLHPVSLSPNGEILVFRTGLSIENKAWVLADQQTFTIPENPSEENVSFIGWKGMDLKHWLALYRSVSGTSRMKSHRYNCRIL